MATAGSVVVNLIANTKSFQQGLKRSKLDMESFRKTVITGQTAIANVGKQMTGMFVTAVATAGLAIGKIIQRNNEMADSFVVAGDETIKFAQRIGIATGELQALQYAGSQTGVKVTALNMGL